MSGLIEPSNKSLLQAYDQFRSLLYAKTVERDWQEFFAKNPFVLSRALPLRLDSREIVPLGKPGISEPDFIFYPKKENPFSSYGAIEIKRPDTRILTCTRKNIVQLTREADTAVKQVQIYARSIILPDDVLFLGSSPFLFVILGLSTELTEKVANDIIRAQLNSLLPPQCQLLPFDLLLRQFEGTIPSNIIVLVPSSPTIEKLVKEFAMALSDEERFLIMLKIQLYGNEWKPMLDDLENRLEGEPYIFKLADRIKDDIARAHKLQQFERKHNVDFSDWPELFGLR
jgi:hypothetical protein